MQFMAVEVAGLSDRTPVCGADLYREPANRHQQINGLALLVEEAREITLCEDDGLATLVDGTRTGRCWTGRGLPARDRNALSQTPPPGSCPGTATTSERLPRHISSYTLSNLRQCQLQLQSIGLPLGL